MGFDLEHVRNGGGMGALLHVVDDHPVVRRRVKSLLGEEEDIRVVGEAVNGKDAIEKVKILQPDMALMDLVMPEMGGIEAIEKIAAAYPNVRILVMTSFAAADKVFPSIKAGALGYLLKDSDPEDLICNEDESEPGAFKDRMVIEGDPYNGLHLCIKGRYGYEFIHHRQRHMKPRVREYLLKNEPRPAKRGTEAALVNGLMNIILEKGWENKDALKKYPNGFKDAKKMIDDYIPTRVSELTGVPVDQLYAAAEILASNHPAAVLWSMGISNPEATHALANLQLLLGNLDQAGGGVNPLRAQNNSQGASDMGCAPDFLPGYQPVSDANARGKFEQAWGSPIRAEAGMNALRMVEAAGEGNVRALYIVGEDILTTSPEAAAYREDLEACEFVALQEMAASETTRYADVILPDVSFAEKTGTFTNTERRVQMVHQAIEPLGEARPDWKILTDLGSRLAAGWDYASPAQNMDEIAALTPIYAGVSHDRLQRGDCLQWPVESKAHNGTPILPIGLFGEVSWAAAEKI